MFLWPHPHPLSSHSPVHIKTTYCIALQLFYLMLFHSNNKTNSDYRDTYRIWNGQIFTECSQMQLDQLPVAGEVGNKYPVSSSQVGITWSHVLQCPTEFSSETESWVPIVDASLRILPWLASCYSLFQVPIPLPVFSDITSQGNCLYSNPHLDCTWNPQIKPKGEDLTRGIFQNTRNNMLKRISSRARR